MARNAKDSAVSDAVTATDWVAAKRDGREHTPKEIAGLLGAFLRGDVTDYQMSAWLMAVYLQGMTDRETVALTEAMRDSGRVLSLDSVPGFKVDKHSTGGVGTLPLKLISMLSSLLSKTTFRTFWKGPTNLRMTDPGRTSK